MIMIHSDEKGLVVPPRVAPTQVVIIPIVFQGKDNTEVFRRCNEIYAMLKKNNIRVLLDERELNPGRKFNDWELKGAAIQFKMGPADVKNNTVSYKRRDQTELDDELLAFDDTIVEKTKQLLDNMHKNLFEKAKKIRDEKTVKVTSWKDFTPALEKKNMVLAPWCSDSKCEDEIKEKSKQEAGKGEGGEEGEDDEEGVEPLTGAAKSLCMPFDQPSLTDTTVCFHCGKKANTWCLFGRSY